MDYIMTTEFLQNVYDGHPRQSFRPDNYNDYVLEGFTKSKLALENMGISDPASVKFNPDTHLTYYTDAVRKHEFQSTRRLTMEELGLTNKKQISPIGVSDPFPLFTDEAVHIMRYLTLEKEFFLREARFSPSATTDDGLDNCVRGCFENTPFIMDAWKHPKTMELVSLMAGVELEVIMDCEVASTNIGLKSKEQANSELAAERDKVRSKGSGEDIPAIVGWHHDSYPFVCVLMLSDTTNMIGGETSLRMGQVGDEPHKLAVVPGPQQGYACVLQGRLIEHIAPSPLGVTERITAVTSYRAKNPQVTDDSVLKTVKPEVIYGSRYNSFYPEWIDYRSEIVKARLDELNEKLKAARTNGETFDKEYAVTEMKSIANYFTKTFEEMAVTDAEWEKGKSQYERTKQ